MTIAESLITPPHNLEAEQALLGSVLIDPDMAAGVPTQAGAFYSVKHGWIWQVVSDLQGRGDPVDLFTVQQELDRRGQLAETGGPAYLTRLVTLTPSACNAIAYGRMVDEAATRRRLIRAASDIAKLAFEESADMATVISRCEAALSDVTTQAVSSGTLESAYDVSSRVIDRLLNPAEFAKHIRAVGLEPVDMALGGGIEAKTLTVVMARPGMGKTAVLCQIADTVSERGEVVVFLSKEMSAEAIMNRMVARRARVNMLRLKQGQLSSATQTRTIDIAAKLSERKTLFIDDSASQTTAEVSALCNRVARKFGRVDWLIADHLRLFSDTADNETHRLGAISWRFKQIAKQLQTRVLVAAQLSRGVEGQADRRPDLKDLRDSGEIEENADNVIGLYRDEYYNPKSNEGNKIEFLFAKARDGERGARPAMAFLKQYGACELLASRKVE